MRDTNCLFACTLKALIPTLLPRGEAQEHPSPCGRGESESKNFLTLTLSQRERERLMIPART